MSFTLTINDETSNKPMTINEPTIADIKKAIDILKQDEQNFLILDSSPPVELFSVIQAYFFDDNTFHAETRYDEGNALYMYSHELTEKDLTKILSNFISGIVPDIDDWEYEDDFGGYEFYKEFKLRKFLAENGFLALKVQNPPANSIQLTTSDIQVFIKIAKDSNVKTVFYSYDYVNKDIYNIDRVRHDNDLSKVASDEIVEYMKNINTHDFDQPAILELFFMNYGTIISMKIIDHWVEELTPANKFIDFLEMKYSEKLTEVKSDRYEQKDALLEELKTLLLNDSEFIYCTNRDLRRDFMRKFLIKPDNRKYVQAFLNDNGYLNQNELQNFVDMVYAVYKRMEKLNKLGVNKK